LIATQNLKSFGPVSNAIHGNTVLTNSEKKKAAQFYTDEYADGGLLSGEESRTFKDTQDLAPSVLNMQHAQDLASTILS
jgi:hypothetical protein